MLGEEKGMKGRRSVTCRALLGRSMGERGVRGLGNRLRAESPPGAGPDPPPLKKGRGDV